MENSKDKKLIITPLDESTKKISQVLANDTCRKILDIISDEALSSSQISEKLNLALTTVDYNVKKLAEVGLITVHHKKWSQKGKKVNYYAPAEKFILIAPKASTAQIFKVLKTLIPILAIIGLFIGILGGMFLQKPAESTSGQRFLSESEFSQEKAAQPQAVETTTAGGVGANVGLTVGNYTNNTTITADVVK